MLKFPVKVHTPIGSVTEFILRKTNLDLKELIPKAVTSYIIGNIGDRLTRGNIEICERKETIPTYITVYFNTVDAEIINFLNNLGEKKISTACRNIFEAKFVIQNLTALSSHIPTALWILKM